MLKKAIKSLIVWYKKALDTVDNLEDMSEQEFAVLIAEKISILDAFERKEILRIIENKSANWNAVDENSLTLDV